MYVSRLVENIRRKLVATRNVHMILSTAYRRASWLSSLTATKKARQCIYHCEIVCVVTFLGSCMKPWGWNSTKKHVQATRERHHESYRTIGGGDIFAPRLRFRVTPCTVNSSPRMFSLAVFFRHLPYHRIIVTLKWV